MVTTVLSTVTNLRTADTYLKYKHWSLVQPCQYGDFCNLTNLLGLLSCRSKNFKTVWRTRELASKFGNIRNEKTLSKCTYKLHNILGHKITIHWISFNKVIISSFIIIKHFWKKSNRHFSTISCFSHPSVTVALNLVTEIVTFIFKNLCWIMKVIHTTLRIIKILRYQCLSNYAFLKFLDPKARL